MADTHKTPTPHAPVPQPAAASRSNLWIIGWAVISVAWVVGAWLYFFTFSPIQSASPYSPLSAEEKACIARYSDKDRQKSCRDLVGVQTRGDVTGQYFTRGMFVFVPPLILAFLFWLKLQADKERATPVGRPKHLMSEDGSYSPIMEEAIAENEAKRAKQGVSQNLSPELANLFGQGDQRPRR